MCAVHSYTLNARPNTYTHTHTHNVNLDNSNKKCRQKAIKYANAFARAFMRVPIKKNQVKTRRMNKKNEAETKLKPSR